MQQRKGNPPRRERFARQMRADDRVLAPGKEHAGPLELGSHFAQHVDRLRLKLTQVSGLGSRLPVGRVDTRPMRRALLDILHCFSSQRHIVHSVPSLRVRDGWPQPLQSHHTTTLPPFQANLTTQKAGLCAIGKEDRGDALLIEKSNSGIGSPLSPRLQCRNLSQARAPAHLVLRQPPGLSACPPEEGRTTASCTRSENP